MRPLINNDGLPFGLEELRTLQDELCELSDEDRKIYRNQNAKSIAVVNTSKFLILSGPGTGKSYLFLEKIRYWLNQDPDAKIFVTSFVRKLITDLQSDIDSNQQLSKKQKKSITVSTLHRFARSIVEKNRGTSEWSFQPHFNIITGELWENLVWQDVRAFHPELTDEYSWEKLKFQYYEAVINESAEWQDLNDIFYRLCHFYNAASFADLINRVTIALSENPGLNDYDYYIIDEFQDFNSAENELIERLTKNANGLLIVGDDEQVLYEKLKSGDPALIRSLYKDNSFTKGMLPFCSRSSYHITRTADHFISNERDKNSIQKIFLPISNGKENDKVQIIACSTPQTAVDYIGKFIEVNRSRIDERKLKLISGEEKDAYLLILTPTNDCKYLGNAKDELYNLISDYKAENMNFSEDYYKLLNYNSLANYPSNNFTFRKVLHYESISGDEIHKLIEYSLQNNKNFCDIESDTINAIIKKCHDIKLIIDDESAFETKIERLQEYINIDNKQKLCEENRNKSIQNESASGLKHKEDEDAELEEIEVKKTGAIELLTIVGSKGLSADHVIIIGFDDVNMNRITKNAFYVALTRARKSLRIITALKAKGAKQAHPFINGLPEEHILCFSYTKANHQKNPLTGKQGFIKYLNNLEFGKNRQMKKN